MKGKPVDIEWRTVQMFLSDEGVHEVSVDELNPMKTRCDCNVFQTYGRCKHARFVKARMAKNEGTFTLPVPSNDLSDEELMDALENSELFRDLIIKYGKVEYLD
jgi:hypothetical protein